jgi:hypothetical protein
MDELSQNTKSQNGIQPQCHLCSQTNFLIQNMGITEIRTSSHNLHRNNGLEPEEMKGKLCKKKNKMVDNEESTSWKLTATFA